MALTKQQLLALNNSSFPNNNAGFITPELLRTYNSSSIGAFVDEIDYTIDSASVDVRLDNLENFSSSLVTNFATVAYVNGVSASLTSTASFNAYTQSTNNTINGLATTASVNAITQSVSDISTSVGLLQTFSGSQYKADSASFSSRIISAENTGYVTTASFNAYTQSTNTFTASISTSVGLLETFSSSQYKSDSSSFDSRLDSTATTGSNTFNGNQIINGNVSASSFISASNFIGNGSQLTGITASVSIAILDEGIYQGNATSLNFTGSGLTASVVAGVATIIAQVDQSTLNQYTLTSSFNSFTSSYYTDSASFNSRIDAVDVTGYVTTGSFNTYTSSQDFKNTTFATTGSNSFVGNQIINGVVSISSSATYDLDITGAFQATAASRVSSSTAIATISPTFFQTTSGSFPTAASSIIGRGYTQATFNTNTITMFASGGTGIGSVGSAPLGSSGIAINSGSVANTFYYPIIFQSSTGYTDGRVTFTTPLSASAGITASNAFINGELYSNTSASFDSRIIAATGSTIYTGSFATTGSNTFVGNQTINGDISASGNISASSLYATNATIINLTTIYETSSVIYSSGSNQLGDELTDVQILSGSVLIVGSGSVNGNRILTTLDSASMAVSSSLYSVTASYAVNGGVTQILAGPNITVSPLSGKGQVTISSTGTGSGNFNTATGSYGSFYDTTTQPNPVANTANSMSFNETAITNGVSISGSTNPFNTYIKTENAGVYNLQFSAQLDKTDSGTDSIDIWIRKNGIDLLDAGTTVTLTGNNDKSVAAWNWFVQSAANDYYQIIWASADTDMRLLAEVSSSVHPGIPSVIATINRVDQFLSNTGSFTGSFNGYNLTEFTTTSSFNAFTQSISSSVDTISSSVGLLQTFSGSQYKNDSSSFDSRINAIPTVNTGSFATTGSNNFIGNQSITGSLILSSSVPTELQVIGGVEITGSVAGNITALSVASSTASIDFNLGTFFTLTIPSSSVTYITGSNLKPGMTANIVLTQQSTTGSVRFESSLFKFPSGSINTGSAVASAVDIVSVMSVNTTTLLSVGANRLI